MPGPKSLPSAVTALTPFSCLVTSPSHLVTCFGVTALPKELPATPHPPHPGQDQQRKLQLLQGTFLKGRGDGREAQAGSGPLPKAFPPPSFPLPCSQALAVRSFMSSLISWKDAHLLCCSPP